VDGGTQGLLLLPYVEEADRLILFDAIDFGLTPGTLKVYRDDAVPAYLTAKKMSLHQTGFPRCWRWPTSKAICRARSC
jgi:hydrogenase maturation protease